MKAHGQSPSNNSQNLQRTVDCRTQITGTFHCVSV